MKKRILFSIILGIAVISLGNEKVNAASVYADTLPETITTSADAGKYYFINGVNITDTSKSNFPFFALDSTGKYQLYCSDRLKGSLEPSKVLTKGDELDYGIAYILMNSYPTKEREGAKTTDPVSSDTIVQHMPDIWLTQVALWTYQGSFAASEPSSDLLNITPDSTTYYEYDLTGEELYKKVSVLVNEAKNAKNPATATDILSFSFDGKWDMDENTKIAKSHLITLASTDSSANLASYKLSMENAPENTKVYDENGNDITSSINNMSTNKFYIAVDTNKQETDATFKVTAQNVKITYQTAYQYVDKSTQCTNSSGVAVQCQPTVLVGPATRELSTAIDLKVTYAPDTSSGISKAIYVLGFIILICGATIIYANVKPKKDEIQI